MRTTRLALICLTVLALPAGPALAAGVSDAALLATNSIDIDQGSTVTGDVAVNFASPGPTLDGVELDIDKSSSITGNVKADSVDIHGSVAVSGVISCNDGSGACTGLTFPLFEPLPTFRTALPGTDPVSVGNNQTLTLAPGAYGHVSIGKNGTLVLEGGGYDVASVNGGSGSTILFQAASQLRVEVEFVLGNDSAIGPDGAGLDGSDFVIYVAGTNSVPEDPSSAAAAEIGRGASLEANFYVANGTFQLDRDSALTGAVIARDISLDKNATIVLASAFNLPPEAIGQTVETNGVDPVSFDLSGCDLDGDVLTFTLVSGPFAGSLSGLPGSDPGAPDPSCTDDLADDPAVTVTYDAAVEGATDFFVFQVDDGKGGTDDARVDINPVDDTPPDPPEAIVAKDVTVETTTGNAVIVPLGGAAPDTVTQLVFTVVAGSGPASGGLGAIVQVGPYDAEVVYTPTGTFEGSDGFQFEACDIGAPTVCDTAIVTIQVDAEAVQAPPVAVNQGYTTPMDTPVMIDLNISPTEQTTGDCGRDNPEDCPDGGGS